MCSNKTTGNSHNKNSNVVRQTNQNESSDSSQDTENENEGENQSEEFIQNENRFESTRAILLQIHQIQTKWEVSFPFAFIHLAKRVGCVSYAPDLI